MTMLPVLLMFLLAPAPAKPADAAPAAAPKIESIAWMAGHWSATDADGSTTEEMWLAPKGGIMVGVNRMTSPSPGEPASFEYLRIEQRADGVFYMASPAGGTPTPFRLTSATSSTAMFENPEHDFPKRILYRLDGDTLSARIDGGGGEKDHAMGWSWKRQ